MTWFKRLTIAVVAIGLLIVLGVVVLWLTVDPNAYKAPLAEQVLRRYDRTLRIDGDVKLALFPRLGLDIGRAALSEPGRPNETFAAFESAKVAVALWPLLRREVVIDHVQVVGLQANLQRDAAGRFNFDDLLGRGPQPADHTPVPVPVPGGKSSAPLQVDIAGISVAGGVSWRDAQRDVRLRLEKLRATTGRIAPGVPVDIDIAAQVMGESPQVDAAMQVQGTAQFDAAMQKFAARKLEFKASGLLPAVRAGALSLRGNFDVDTAQDTFDASNLSFAFDGDVVGKTPVSGLAVRVEALALGVAPSAGRLTVDRLVASAAGKSTDQAFDVGLEAPAVRLTEAGGRTDAVTGRIALSGRRTLDAKLALNGLRAAPDTWNAEALTVDGTFAQGGGRSIGFALKSPVAAAWTAQRVTLSALDGNLQIKDPALPGKALAVPLRGRLDVEGAAQRAAAQLIATVEQSQIEAKADVTGFDAPRVRFAFAADVLDLDRWLPADAAPAPAAAAPAPAPAATADTPATPAPAAPAGRPIDLGVLQNLDVDGSVRIGALAARGLHLRDLAAQVRVRDGRAELNDVKATLYEGTLAARAFADGKGNRFGVNADLQNVAILPLLRDVAKKEMLSGRGRVALALETEGPTIEAVRAATHGTVDVALRDGAIRGVNLAQSLRDFKAMIGRRQDDAQASDSSRSTDFSQLDAHLDVAKGVGTLSRLDVRAPLLRVTQGSPARIDFVGGQFDVVARVNVVNTTKGQGGAELAALKDITVPVQVSGPFEAPTWRIRWTEIGSEALQNALRGAIEERLGGDREQAEEKLKGVIGERLKKFLGR